MDVYKSAYRMARLTSTHPYGDLHDVRSASCADKLKGYANLLVIWNQVVPEV